VAVVSTGDELVEVEALVAPHQIRRSNDYALRSALIQAGYPHADRFHLRDIRHEIEHMLWHILAEYDVLLITGGISKGKFDFLPSELEHPSSPSRGTRYRPTPAFTGMCSRRLVMRAA
jgi:molybdopterin molybdotransferase